MLLEQTGPDGMGVVKRRSMAVAQRPQSLCAPDSENDELASARDHGSFQRHWLRRGCAQIGRRRSVHRDCLGWLKKE